VETGFVNPICYSDETERPAGAASISARRGPLVGPVERWQRLDATSRS
jgi:hypothetical protein